MKADTKPTPLPADARTVQRKRAAELYDVHPRSLDRLVERGKLTKLSVDGMAGVFFSVEELNGLWSLPSVSYRATIHSLLQDRGELLRTIADFCEAEDWVGTDDDVDSGDLVARVSEFVTRGRKLCDDYSRKLAPKTTTKDNGVTP